MTPSECEDCEYDNDCDNQCSESVLHILSVYRRPLPSEKIDFFLRGEKGLYTGSCRCRAINIPSDQTVEKEILR